MILKIGSKGKQVKQLQEFLNIKVDGDFGPATLSAVKEFQSKNGLTVDGVVGLKTWDEMGIASTDNLERVGLIEYDTHYLPKGEYKEGPTNKEYLFLHHTAGWHNPYNQIEQWGRDNRGTICTEFVLGGSSIKGNDNDYDGVLVQAFPDGGYGWHLGKNGSQHMHTHSVGVELCNFGYLKEGKTAYGHRAADSQIVTLKKEFRGFKQFHKYSDAQIKKLKELIIFIANRDSIDITKGLPSLIKDKGTEAFEWNADAYYGKIKGVWCHTNTRKDKWDLFPQPELMDMLTSL